MRKSPHTNTHVLTTSFEESPEISRLSTEVLLLHFSLSLSAKETKREIRRVHCCHSSQNNPTISGPTRDPLCPKC